MANRKKGVADDKTDWGVITKSGVLLCTFNKLNKRARIKQFLIELSNNELLSPYERKIFAQCKIKTLPAKSTK